MKTHISPYAEPSEAIGNVAELFAGVGGFRLGLARSGWKTVFSNQWEPSSRVQHASDVYVANFGPEGHANVDVSSLERIPVGFDLLVGGFPCQDYSVAKSAGSASGLQGKKGVLWWEILRLIELHRPPLVFLENVDRLLKSPASQRGRDFAVMLATLGSAGYDVEWRVVNSADYGFPQRRVRVFIVARLTTSRRTISSPEATIFSDGVLATSLPVEANSAGLHEISIPKDPVDASTNFNRQNSKGVFGTAGFFAHGAAFSTWAQPVIAREKSVLADVLVSDESVPDEFWVPESRRKDWEYLKGAKQIPRIHKESGFEYFYSEGSMTFPDALDRPSRTVLTGEGGTSPSRFKHVIETPSGMRRLTPVELERLSGFPDGWTSPGGLKISSTRRAFLIGNALVVGLVEKVGESLARLMESEIH